MCTWPVINYLIRSKNLTNSLISKVKLWLLKIYHKFHYYYEGGVGLGSLDVNGATAGAGRAAIKIPPLFTRSWSNSQDIDRVKDFFVKEKGSVAITDAVCLTHKIDISDLSKKQFVEPFIDSVRSIYSVIKSGNKNAQIREFKRFVNEFGTHYSSSAEMGTRISIERRYTAAERSGAEDNELKDCNTVAGILPYLR